MSHPQSTGNAVDLFEFTPLTPRESAAPLACLIASERLTERGHHYLSCSMRTDGNHRKTYSAVATELLRIAADLRAESGY